MSIIMIRTGSLDTTEATRAGSGSGTQGHGCDGHCGGRYTWEHGMALLRKVTSADETV